MSCSDSGPGVSLLALEARLAPRVDPGNAGTGDELLLGDDLVSLDRLEDRRARRGFAAFRRAAFRSPLLESAVEDRDPVCAEMPKHEPAARGSPDGRIVVNDDAVVATHAEPLHRFAEIRRVW